MPEEVISVVAGLGNPGPEYVDTRHNAGFWFADELVARHGGRYRAERKFTGVVAEIYLAAHRLLVLKPATFMNRSGESVAAMCRYLKISPAAVMVVHDDLDLPPGTARFKWGGGAGGHNGLRDLIAHCGRDFWRLRLGIGHPGERHGVVDYVLHPPARRESELIEEAAGKAADALEIFLRSGSEAAMNELHRRPGKAGGGESG